MTAPDPHTPPPDRFGVRAGRGVFPAGRSATRPSPESGATSPLQRLLESTAVDLTRLKPAAPDVHSEHLWRRPERHGDASPVLDDERTLSTSEPQGERAGAFDDLDDLPPILAAMLAARGGVPADAPPLGHTPPEVAEADAGAAGAEAGSGSGATGSEDAAGLVALEAEASETADAHAAVVAEIPEAQPPHPVWTAPLAIAEPHHPSCPSSPSVLESLPYARLAAVACAEGEPEPPILRPSAAVVSRLRPLSRLRPTVRHGRRRRRWLLVVGLAAASALVAAVAGATTAALVPAHADSTADTAPVESLQVSVAQDPPPVASIDTPATAAVAALGVCDRPAELAALTAGDATGAISAAGGGQALRDAVATGAAPCVNLADSSQLWIVVNKQRTNNPVDYAPASTAVPDGVVNINGSVLRSDAAAALSKLAAASEAAGAGPIGLNSGFRSYDMQVATHESQVENEGVQQAEASSARAGYSEHQTGLAADLVACGDGCGGLDDFGATAQGQWVAANAWQFGWIVRYEAGTTPTTGYVAEPWHVRYVGPELAAAYHAGGYHTLEEFFGLPAAPGY